MLLIFLWKSVNFSIYICVSCTIYGPSLLLNTFKHNFSKISVFEKNYNQPTQKNICSKRKNKYLFPILQPVIKKSEINHKNINRRIFFFFNFSSFYLYLALWVTKYLFCKFFLCSSSSYKYTKDRMGRKDRTSDRIWKKSYTVKQIWGREKMCESRSLILNANTQDFRFPVEILLAWKLGPDELN